MARRSSRSAADTDPRVYSYLRFSDIRQGAGSSVDRQLSYAAEYAAKHSLQLDDTLSLRDEGLSAYHQKHVTQGAFGAFLRAIHEGRVPPGSVLIVEALDRISRAEPIVAQGQLAQIVNAGITVVTAADEKVYSKEVFKSDSMAIVYSLLIMIRAHEESARKADRVKLAIAKQCQDWVEGRNRDRIVNGRDPMWLRYTGTRRKENAWEPIPERVAALKEMIRLFLSGYGIVRVMSYMTESGLTTTGRRQQRANMYRILRSEALIGNRVIEVLGKEYVLHGYYPAVIDVPTWDKLQVMLTRRSNNRMRYEIPGMVTGLGIFYCGYCGTAMIAQNLGNRARADGTLADGHRRMHCVAHSQQGACKAKGSSSIVPLERAIFEFCEDQFNLESLFNSGDRSAPLRAVCEAARGEVAALEKKIRNVRGAIEDAEDGAPRELVDRLRELSAQATKARSRHADAERELSLLQKRNAPPNKASEWKAIAQGALALDYDCRAKARQLVMETFERIVVYRLGVGLDNDQGLMEVVLHSKGGVTRTLSFDRKTGKLRVQEHAKVA